MPNPVINYFNQHLTLTPEEIAYLEKNIPFVNLEKRTLLLSEGEISSAFYFVLKGCIRMYYLVDGMEKTTFFYLSNSFVSSYESFTKKLPSKHYLKTSQDSTIAVFKEETIAEILQLFPRFEILARIAMEEELSVYQEMIASFITLNAEQRYLKLINKNPELLQIIPQYHLATYLGVSPETLSRIRTRIKKK